MDKKNDIKVTCIIPAYNEAKTISGVVKVCLQTPEIGEIIVVNDGSTDRTSEKLKKIKTIKVINLAKNHGKGYAVSRGIKASKFQYLLFLDADLTNFFPHHLFSLISPITSGRVDMTIADLKASFFKPRSAIWPFSGQRCFPKKLLLPLLKEIAKSKYGLEFTLNERFKNKRVIVIPWISEKELYLKKPKKQNDWLANYIKEIWEVTQAAIKTRSKIYRKKTKDQLIKNLSKYLKINIKKIEKYFKDF